MEDGKSKNNESVIHPVFARHETFHPRFGWLKVVRVSAGRAALTH